MHDIMEVVVVLVVFFGMDHQHQQRLQTDQRLLTLTAHHIRYLLVVVVILLDLIQLIQKEDSVVLTQL